MSTRIALLSPCGGGNLGDAAIIDALIAGIRRRITDAEIVGFTGNPDDTIARHGIPAERLVWRPEAGEAKRRPRLERLPGVRFGLGLGRRVLGDDRHYREAARRISGFRYVVVAGGGQFDDFYGGPYRYPYALWRWGRLARAARAQYLILSVGTGRLRPPSRFFVRRALESAGYASFRDERSRELVGDDAFVRQTPVVPDLAYSYPLPGDLPSPTAPSLLPVVGVSPMSYGDPRSWPEENAALYRRHVGALAAFAVKLVRTGHRVVLFVSDGPDRLTLEDVRGQALAALDPAEQSRLSAPPVTGIRDLIGVLGQVDLVVAARLHGVLLAHVTGRPALALSHERKVATLMSQMDHSRYCTGFDDFEAERGWQLFLELSQRRAELGADIRAKAAAFRGRVEAQYDRVFQP